MRLVHLNVYTDNEEYERVHEYLRMAKTDVVLLQEVNARWMRAIQLWDDFQVVVARSRRDNFGLVLLAPTESDRDITIEDVRIFNIQQVPVIEAKLKVAEQLVFLLYVHTLPPVGADYARAHAEQISAIEHWIDKQSGPCIIAGDLNETPWSSGMKRLLARDDLLSSQQGYGIKPTWPTRITALMGVAIDHCLHSRELITVNHQVGPALGSDHRPLLVDLAWR